MVWHGHSDISYAEYSLKAVADAVARGHSDPAALREILTWTTDSNTAPTAEAYLAQHRNDPELLKALIAIALEGEDAGDGPWAAANAIAEYPAAMLALHKSSLKQLAREQWSYLHVPARKALAKVAAAASEIRTP